jgi:signal transduction histidine kinase
MRWQRRVLMAEQSASLERERARIARDLHDDLGTALTGLALEADLARRNHANGAAPVLERISSGSRELADRMREVVWAINPRCDSVDDLVGFFTQYAGDFLGTAGFQCRLNLPAEINGLSLGTESRHQLFAAFKEALHNVVKHSKGSAVEIAIQAAEEILQIEIIDNGIGFSGVAPNGTGNGLKNLRERLETLGGEARFENAPAGGPGGARVLLRIPISRNRSVARP